MRLTDLEPHWLTNGGRRVGITFRCPHCREYFLSCFSEKFPVLRRWADEEHKLASQYDLLIAQLGKEAGQQAIPCDKNFAWKFMPAIETANFETLTIKPSIDASKSGHWHGFITNGEVK